MHNRPNLLLRVLKNWCREDGVEVMNYVNCEGFKIVPKYSFYPINYSHWQLYFVHYEGVIEEPLYVENKMSSKRTMYKNSNQPFFQIA